MTVQYSNGVPNNDEMKLPFRHKSELFKQLDLHPFPNDIEWNGSIIYLDRDGVLNKGSENYINSPEELEILPGVANSIARLKESGFRICVVTNQSPINRGYWGHEMLEEIHEKLILELKNNNKNAHIDLILYSPYTPSEDSISRKPRTGMIIAGQIVITASEKFADAPTHFDEPNPNLWARNYDEFINEDLEPYSFFYDAMGEGPMSALVGDRMVDYQAAERHNAPLGKSENRIRPFLVDGNIGLPQVIDRLLDKTDKGDVLQ